MLNERECKRNAQPPACSCCYGEKATSPSVLVAASQQNAAAMNAVVVIVADVAVVLDDSPTIE